MTKVEVRDIFSFKIRSPSTLHYIPIIGKFEYETLSDSCYLSNPVFHESLENQQVSITM